MAVSENRLGHHKNRPQPGRLREEDGNPQRSTSRSVSAIRWNARSRTSPTVKKFITQEQIDRINENYKKGQQNADK